MLPEINNPSRNGQFLHHRYPKPAQELLPWPQKAKFTGNIANLKKLREYLCQNDID
jgi:hypothetical protein